MELNGKPATLKDITPLALYNYGNFTTILVEDLKARGLSLHLERLRRDAALLHGEAPSDEELRAYISHAVGDRKGPIVVRVTLFCTDFDMAHPDKSRKPDVLVSARPSSVHDLPPLSLKPITYQRISAEIKSTAIGLNFYQRRQAQLAGFDDALLINEDKEISEGPTWNIGFLQKGTLITPGTPALDGVTMELLRQTLGTELPIRSRTISLKDIPSMDAAFISNAPTGLRPVAKIGDHGFTAEPMIEKLQQIYLAATPEPL